MKIQLKLNTVVPVILFLITAPAHAQLRLPKIFGDSMVLQRNAPIKIWGWASPGETIRVKFHNQQRVAQAGPNGSWATVLAPEPVGGPYILQVREKTTITLRGILMGDIWVCSGQSNMEMGTGVELRAGDCDSELSRHPLVYR
jgi:sialate O-acetylesterase